MRESEIITHEQLTDIQSQIESIDDKKKQMIDEQTRLTNLFMKQQEQKHEVVEQIAKFLIEKENFLTFDDFLKWYNGKEKLETDESYEKVRKPKSKKSRLRQYEYDKQAVRRLTGQLNDWMYQNECNPVDVSQILDKDDDYIVMLDYRVNNHETETKLHDLVTEYEDIMNILNELVSQPEEIEPSHTEPQPSSGRTPSSEPESIDESMPLKPESTLNGLMSEILVWATERGLSKSETSRRLGKANTYINNLVYKVNHVKSTRDEAILSKRLKRVIKQLNRLHVSIPRKTNVKVNLVPDNVTMGELNRLKDIIDTWINEHRITKSELSSLSGYTNTYINQQYTKLGNNPKLSQRKSIAKALNKIINFMNQCDDPLNSFNRALSTEKFTIMVKKSGDETFKYYAEEPFSWDTYDYLELHYTDSKYAAKLLDKDAITRFYTNFKLDYPDIPITVMRVPESEISKYVKS